MTKVEGFEPYFNNDSRVLILGSFPSVKSREEGFYYGNPRNSFWKIISGFFFQEEPKTVQDKKELLSKTQIALWDIVTGCEIIGSRDDSIKNYKVADLSIVLNSAPVKFIILNGGTAYKIFKKAYGKNIGEDGILKIGERLIKLIALPSTSPANAHPKKDIWYGALSQAFR